MTTRPDFEALFRASPHPCLVMDGNLLIVGANDAWLRLHGQHEAALLGRELFDALPGMPAAARVSLDVVIRTGQPHSVAVDSGNLLHVPVLTGDGAIALITQTWVEDDIARAQTEAALRTAARHKDEFLGVLAHQLRSPLAPINSAARLLQQVRLDERRLAELASIILRQSAHAASMVDDLRDIERIAHGKLTPAMAPCDAKRVVADAVEQLRPLADKRSQRMAVLLPIDPIVVMGEHHRLVQVIANLLDNAVRHTGEGGNIVLRMESDGASVTLRVHDDGSGIDAALLPQVFDLFARGTPQSGLGVGLALVQRLVGLHGGTVSARSDGVGKGAEFAVTLPLAPKSVSIGVGSYSSGAWVLPPKRPLRLMVVDDNPDAALTLSMLLEASGYDVTTENSGKAGLARALRDAPDVCLLDIGMPGMDGYQLARALRAHPTLAGTKLIAVTGFGQESDVLQARAAGFDHHLVKPVDGLALSALLEDCAR